MKDDGVTRAHPAADLFPMMSDAELRTLADDIRKSGLKQPIVTVVENGERVVLDGRNRFRACAMAGVAPTFIAFDGADPFALVVSANLHRRHLTESQRAMIADDLARLKHGSTKNQVVTSSNDSHTAMAVCTQSEAAKLLGVSLGSVQRARRVRVAGVPELGEAVRAGAVSVRAAERVARMPEEKQRRIVSEGTRQQIRAHDLRATFVTLALAAGKSETWVADRTGHKSSEMINRYRRQARQLSERGITYDSLVDLDVAIGFRSEPVTASGDPPPSRTGDGLASEDEVRTGAAVALAIAVTPLGGGTTGRAGDPEPEAPTVYPCGCSRQDVIYGRCTHEPAPALRASTEEQAVSDVGSFVGSTPDSGEVDAVGFAEFMSGIQAVPKEGIEPSREVSRRILNPGKCIEVSRDASKQGPFDTSRSASHHGSHVDPTPSESDHTSSDRGESVADLDDASGVLPTSISEVQISGLDVVTAACFCAHPGPGRAAECCAGVTFLAGEFVECVCICHEARSHAAFVREATDALLGLCDERGIEVVDG